jgi:adenylate cyclase
MMLRKFARSHLPAVVGIITLVLLLAATALAPRAWREVVRENAFDLLLLADQYVRRITGGQAQPGERVVIVDIDRQSLETIGAWPWPRDTMARLVEAVAAGKPAAIALDILFGEPDSRSPAALARRLGALTGRVELKTLADELPDGDKHLAAALKTAPAVLGFVLDPDQVKLIPTVPIVARGPLPVRDLWRSPGAIGPASELGQAAQGIGALSLPGDADGLVRRIPLLVAAADVVLPGLALEAIRVGKQASAYLIQSESGTLRVGELVLPLPADGLLRLVPEFVDPRTTRTLAAADLINRQADATSLQGAVAVIGSSAPELGGLRAASFDPLKPSVQIQANAIKQILSGRVPRPLDGAKFIEPFLFIAIGALAIWAGVALAPVAGTALVLATVVVSWVLALALAAFADRLVDPLPWSAAAMLTFAAASTTDFARTRRREALVRRRFEQHLAPAVVRRIVEEPSLMKLSGERREVTAFFTDVESFTAMTRRAEPERLVAVLDDYFEGAAAIVIEHGGMIDKIVGDAIHALFNVPLDLADHPRRAIDCSIALREWAAGYRRRAAPTSIGFGRTRIGIETGLAVVGDVGIRAKLDYTAHGDAVNAAARLEAANKELGSTICIGPQAASRCDPALFRPLGTIAVRGRDDKFKVYEPWPTDTTAVWRQRYLEAFAEIERNPQYAIDLFKCLAGDSPDDPVLARMIERLTAGCDF